MPTCITNVGQSGSDHTGTDGLNWFSVSLCGLNMLRQTFSTTSNSDRTINHSIHLIYCNHARLDLRIQQIMSPAGLTQLTPFLSVFQVKHALQRPCSLRLELARKCVQTLMYIACSSAS